MPYSQIKSQERAITILKNAINAKKLAQSYLFYGPDGVGKFSTALLFAMAINCESMNDLKPCGVCRSCQKIKQFNHPDFLYIFPSSKLDISVDGEIKSSTASKEYTSFIENKKNTPWKPFYFSSSSEIRIDSIRMLQHKINRSSYEAQYKIFLIEDIDKMGVNASNAFLKTLEEPPSDSIIILTTTKINVLLPTILSRCQKIPFQPIPRKIIEQELEKKFFIENVRAKFIARISNGSMEKAFQIAEDGEIKIREELIEFLTLVKDNNQLAILEFIQRYKSTSLKTQLNDFLSYLIVWLGDIAIYNVSPNDIVNIDQPNLLDAYISKRNIERQIPNFITKIEEYKKNLAGHINPQLILTDLFFKIRTIFFE